MPPWTTLFARMPAAAPLRWKPFWNLVTRCGPRDGVRWLTIPGGNNQPYQIRVFTGDQERTWRLPELFDQAWPEPERFVAEDGDNEDGGNERAVLHIPDSTLASPRDHHRRPQGDSQR